MIITADIANGKLILPDETYSITNNVRTLQKGTRRSYEVIRTIPGDLPYDPPALLPKGL
jgi:hypothetical protein